MSIRKIIHTLSLSFLLSISFLFFPLPIMAGDEAEKNLSADEVSKELANPNTTLASLVFKNQFRSFAGDLPDADDQTSAITLFQPILPFPLDSGSQIIFRPAIPIIWDSPAGNNFDSEAGIGDISFDLVYAPEAVNGWITALGIIGTLPTATNGKLGMDKLSLGPDILFGRVTKKYVLGINPSHQWDIAGSGDEDVSISKMQIFAALLLGKGWSFGSEPIINYDWEQEQWEIPINCIISKTVLIGGRPWKFGTEINYYVERNDDFSPRWMFGINITPVIKNGLVKFFQ